MKNIADHHPTILFPEMKLTFADFFCGCGGLSLGFIKAGLKCVSAMDIAPDALWTYWYNLCYKGWSHFWVDPENPNLARMKKKGMWGNGKTGNQYFKTGVPDSWLSPLVKAPMPCLNLFMYSIMELSPEQWMKLCGVRPGDISIFAGGPPCQGFSACNSKRSVLDERNQLPMRFIYYCKVCRPKIVFMENVLGMLTLEKNKGDKEGPFPIWLREKFSEAGYSMAYKVVNAADYGVPQRRRRVIFIATRNGCASTSLLPSRTHGEAPSLLPYVRVLEAIGHLPPVRASEHWGKGGLHPYGYNAIDGYVICPNCLHYNVFSRTECHSCGSELSDPVKGGILHMPGIGVMVGTKKRIDNEELRKYQYDNLGCCSTPQNTEKGIL
jgi:site-specific DNA-cytosine methylase